MQKLFRLGGRTGEWTFVVLGLALIPPSYGQDDADLKRTISESLLTTEAQFTSFYCEYERDWP